MNVLTSNSLEILYSSGLCLYIFKNYFSEFIATDKNVFLIMENILLQQSQIKLSLFIKYKHIKK